VETDYGGVEVRKMKERDFHENCKCSAVFCFDILYRISTEFDQNWIINMKIKDIKIYAHK
jgi:hypothetical protein